MYQHNPHPQTWCAHCSISCGPAWQRISAEGEYQILCRVCQVERDATFTPEQAILQALIICGLTVGRLNAKGVRR
jgi:hypothetical protein